jgi:hypothetical protein
VAESSHHKCACCWKYLLDVGTHDGHPTRCGVGKVNMPRLNAVLLTPVITFGVPLSKAVRSCVQGTEKFRETGMLSHTILTI